MKSFIAFWKKDIINKLIVLVFLALVSGALGIVVLIVKMPEGNSFGEAFSDFLPVRASPTFDIYSYLTPGTKVPAFTTATANPAAVLSTFTLQPPLPTVVVSTPTLLVLPTLTLELPTLPLSTATQAISNDLDCIPNNPRQTGRVVEILDGNTARMLIDKLVYVVRYIGVAAPEDKIYSEQARLENSKLVYGNDVTLIMDVSDKDPRGRLLRYVIQGNTFINLKLIQQGLGAALDVPPDSACADVFKQVEQAASAAQRGRWSPTATPRP